MTKEELQAKVDALVWYHRIELPHGIVTPGWAPQFPDHYRLPADLTGKRVLDIGAYDGYWTFECLKRGADSALAIDDFSDTIHKGERRSWAQFDLCKKAFGYSDSRCDRVEMSVYDMTHWEDSYDLILFLGCLYHVRHPLLALDIIKNMLKPGGQLILESHISDDWSPYKPDGHGDLPVMEFYPDGQLADCKTNWWGPTLRAIATMMRAAGFERVMAWKIDKPEAMNQCRGYAHGYATQEKSDMLKVGTD